MLTGTLVTVAGFVPIGFARSSAGEYTFSIFAVVAIALIASWIVAVVFSPLLGVAILKKPKHAHEAGPGPILRAFRGVLVAGDASALADHPRHARAVRGRPCTACASCRSSSFPLRTDPNCWSTCKLPQNALDLRQPRRLGAVR